jgi:hypothetical protein
MFEMTGPSFDRLVLSCSNAAEALARAADIKPPTWRTSRAEAHLSPIDLSAPYRERKSTAQKTMADRPDDFASFPGEFPHLDGVTARTSRILRAVDLADCAASRRLNWPNRDGMASENVRDDVLRATGSRESRSSMARCPGGWTFFFVPNVLSDRCFFYATPDGPGPAPRWSFGPVGLRPS